MSTAATSNFNAELAEKVSEAFTRNPKQMTPTVARELGVAEAEVIRHLPNGAAVKLDINRWEELIRRFESLEKVHVITNTGVVVLEVFGQFGNFSTWGEFFNVQTSSIDMHIRGKELGSVFAVQKAGHMDGVNTLSFQFYTHAGNAAFKVFLTFGSKGPSEERMTQFTDIRDEFVLS